MTTTVKFNIHGFDSVKEREVPGLPYRVVDVKAHGVQTGGEHVDIEFTVSEPNIAKLFANTTIGVRSLLAEA